MAHIVKVYIFFETKSCMNKTIPLFSSADQQLPIRPGSTIPQGLVYL